jgi:hypothetical protein
MTNDNLMLGKNPVHNEENKVSGQLLNINGEEYYQIRNYDSMAPFFMSLVSDSNHWMFISSTGGLSAGRINPGNALFPYYTDDKIQETADITGSKTIFRIRSNGETFLWEPFSDRYNGIYRTERNLYKSTTGNKILFEEKNLDLGLSFRYGWMNADRFGWIKKSILTNESKKAVEINLLDGLQNILPYGIALFMQNQFSTLLDGYKKCELIKEVDLGLFRLESIPVDKAEPSEALQVTTIWSYGLEAPLHLMSSRQLDNFRKGRTVTEEKEGKGIKGAFFINTVLPLAKGEQKEWYFVAEVSQDSVKVNNLIHFLENNINIAGLLEENIAEGTRQLRSFVEDADGIQHTADRLITARHFSNVLFNVMRGGIFSEDYTIHKADLLRHIRHFNHRVWEDHNKYISGLPAKVHYEKLEELIAVRGDEDLYRLYYEFLPLTFSRRHGDPSRPWNQFSIEVKDAGGNKILNYQGNWRDIFQNWEALSISFPLYVSSMIAKFVNASSADGYNPYRITRDGIDWEVPEPDNPWSNIGYWGDHQIIYLLRLMEVSHHFLPGRLSSWLNRKMFTYSRIPYRINSYNEIYKNPHDSVLFDRELHEEIAKHVAETGADAKLIPDPSGGVLKVNFTEKLLSPLLSKLSNFIPEAGIWMNTLRPEWNDANNALVGYGVSMVTLYYMRRFVHFLTGLFSSSPVNSFEISVEIAEFLGCIRDALHMFSDDLQSGFTDERRKQLTDQLGMAGSLYRDQIYKRFSGEKAELQKSDLIGFFNLVLKYIDQSIGINKRKDKMYNAYNLVTLKPGSIAISYLYEMLEGQVAVLSSGKLSAAEAAEILDVMRTSGLFRADQESYMLYPAKCLPPFLEKNNIPAEDVKKSLLLSELIRAGDTTVIAKDDKGKFHFNGTFRNADNLKQALLALKRNSGYAFSDEEIQHVLDLFVNLFNHKYFTGRSGTFYKYEGLGSIYWHMVAKLLVAIGENIALARSDGTSSETIQKLMRHYDDVKWGMGTHKSPDQYGACPFEPYSHTPSMAGVQQPGMTGQVKEDIISRFFELGLSVEQGQITLRPEVLKESEFIQTSNYAAFPHLAYTFCRVSIVYLLDLKRGIDLEIKDGTILSMDGYTLNREDTHSILSRDGRIARVIVHLNAMDWKHDL